MRLVLHIGRLTFEGVDGHQADAVREALAAELSRLLTAAPAHEWRTSRQRRVAAPEVSIVASEPVALGLGVAGSVYHAVNRRSS